MPQSSAEDDQRTIKRSQHHFQKPQIHPKNYSLPLSTHSIKKPLNQLFYNHLINAKDSSSHLEITNNFTKFQTSQSPRICINAPGLTTKLEEYNHKDENYSNCCARLFTFMQSTQKQALSDQNKQNEFKSNRQSKQENLRSSFKPNSSDLPLKSTPKPQKSAKLLKKIDHHARILQNLPNESRNQKTDQNDLLNFIEGSRKKRQQLLIQLEQFNFDNLESVCPDNTKYFTPQEKLHKKNVPSVRVQSSRNSVSGSKSNKNFFPKQSPRIVMKESLRQRHFSQSSLKQKKSSLARITPRKEQTKKLEAREFQKKEKKSIQELMRKKKELQKELTSLNEDIVLFNKKKKKNKKNQ